MPPDASEKNSTSTVAAGDWCTAGFRCCQCRRWIILDRGSQRRTSTHFRFASKADV